MDYAYQARNVLVQDAFGKVYERRVGPDGAVEYVPTNLRGRFGLGSPKHENQQAKAIRRKAAGKPSYRQRQASARAARAKRADRSPAPV